MLTDGKSRNLKPKEKRRTINDRNRLTCLRLAAVTQMGVAIVQ